MRIIAGEHRGRTLKAPPDERTRPMLDRVREALFSSLGEAVDDARVLDLFAGTGSLALEALSRGASRARCVESDRSVMRVLRENVAALNLGERVELAASDALNAASWGAADERYELIFVDSPYPLLAGPTTRRLLLNALRTLTRERLAAGGVLVFHAPHAAVDAVEFGEGVAAERRTWGTNDIWRLRAQDATP